MLLVLIGLILRPVAITFRDKRSETGWRETWDWLFFVSGFVPALIFGVAFGNLLQGVPFHFDQALRATYEGDLLGLLNPFALLCGLVSVAMLTMQGAAWLSVKSEGEVSVRARRSWRARGDPARSAHFRCGTVDHAGRRRISHRQRHRTRTVLPIRWRSR